MCSIVGYVYSSLVFFTRPMGSPTYSETYKNIPLYYTLNPPIRYMYPSYLLWKPTNKRRVCWLTLTIINSNLKYFFDRIFD